MKIVLAGSPQISVKAFEKVISNFDVVAIVTQPDKPKGRGMKLDSTPIAKLGEKYDIKTFKPNKISDIANEIKKLKFDLFLTFAFGQKIPTSILEMGKHKPLNIHGSLLPKYRGAAPIHYAILNGDKEIGITLMVMAKEMDAGDMLFKASRAIDDETTTGEGFEIVSELAVENIVSWLEEVEKENINFKKQPENFTYAPKIKKSFGNIEGLSIKEAHRKVKALNPFPGAYILIKGKRLKVFDFKTQQIEGSIKLNLKDGVIYAIDFQWEGKQRRRVSEY